ncbi:hypothetical protein BMETH_72_1 [methanotrophic bacterial endosymbiont of Bathymodiolus sp.]|nr:hypothetical protein BMETH_72_1 [methanotrophic bacterial endosymbiont of Bathymodiolus sp.]
MLHGFHLRFAGHLISCFSQIPYDRLNIATDITDLGKFSCFDFNERRISKPCKSARNFCFTHPGRTNHQNILGRDFIAHSPFDLGSAPAITQGYGNRTLGTSLTDNMLIQLVGDFFRCHLCHLCS